MLTVAPTAASRGWDAAWLRRWLSDAVAAARAGLVDAGARTSTTALQEVQRGAGTVLVTGSFHTVGDVMSRRSDDL